MKEAEFTSLPIRKKSPAGDGAYRYQIHKADGEIVTVEAFTAYEAYTKSAVTSAKKIVRESKLQTDILNVGALKDDNCVIETRVNTVQLTANSAWVRAPKEHGAKSIQDLEKEFESMSLLAMAKAQSEQTEQAPKGPSEVVNMTPKPAAAPQPKPAAPQAAPRAAGSVAVKPMELPSRELSEKEVQDLLKEQE